MVYGAAFVALVFEEARRCLEVQPVYTLEPAEGIKIRKGHLIQYMPSTQRLLPLAEGKEDSVIKRGAFSRTTSG